MDPGKVRAAAAKLRELGALMSVVRFFQNIAAPASHVAVIEERGRPVAAFALLLEGNRLRTAGTFAAPTYRRFRYAANLWHEVHERLDPGVKWIAPTISRRGTAFVETMAAEGIPVTEERRWPVRDASRYEHRAFR